MVSLLMHVLRRCDDNASQRSDCTLSHRNFQFIPSINCHIKADWLTSCRKTYFF